MDVFSFPESTPSTVMGFDFGTKRIGVAFGQSVTCSASALAPLSAQNGTPSWEDIEALLKEWNPEVLVVGYPTTLEGEEQEISRRAQKFAKRLHGRFGIAVYMQDERLTSRAAREDRGGKHGVDSDAAAIIVEDWLRTVMEHFANR